MILHWKDFEKWLFKYLVIFDFNQIKPGEIRGKLDNKEIANASKHHQYLQNENREDICVATNGN